MVSFLPALGDYLGNPIDSTGCDWQMGSGCHPDFFNAKPLVAASTSLGTVLLANEFCPRDEPSSRKRRKKNCSRSKTETTGSASKESSISAEVPKSDVIHVRARRGQATDSHSLAERTRREKISERMKRLQDLVPGCNKISGKAGILDEIINYVQSLQRQVEFLSMKLAAFETRPDENDHLRTEESWGGNMETYLSEDQLGGFESTNMVDPPLSAHQGAFALPCFDALSVTDLQGISPSFPDGSLSWW